MPLALKLQTPPRGRRRRENLKNFHVVECAHGEREERREERRELFMFRMFLLALFSYILSFIVYGSLRLCMIVISINET
jgi:hypothetical protein